jgi:uncharacterized delta-60 repeat protein
MLKGMNRILFRTIIFFFFISSPLLAQQGKLDTTFNTFDDGTVGEGFDGNVRVVLENADETSYIAGDFLNYNGTSAIRILKLDADGNSDTGFTSGVGFDNSVTSGFKTIGGKLLYGGSFTDYDGTSVKRLARLNLDGTLDTTFNTGNIGPNTAVQALAQLSDGSILVAGDAITTYNGISVNNVFKIDSEGVLDAVFSAAITAGTTGSISKVLIQPDGKILICGSFTSFNGTSTRGLTRLNANGTMDASFNANLGTAANLTILAMDLQSDGKIILGGSFTSFNGTSVGRIIRLNTIGTIDQTFNNAKTGFANGIVQVIRFTTEGVYVAGSFTGDYNGIVAKLNRLTLLKSNGDLDSNFDNVTGLASSTFYTIEKAIDGQLFLGGSFTVYDATVRGRLLKVDKEGVLDSDFMSSGGVGANGTVFKVIPLTSKKSMIFGSFTSFNGVLVSRMARLNEDGSLDLSFNSGGIGVSSTIRSAVELADGSFIIGGDFTKYNGVTRNRILKISASGVLDATFNPNFNGIVYSIAIDSNGKILVGGNFTTVGGIAKNRLVRLNNIGTLDNSFNADVDDVVEAIAIEVSSAKIVIGGRFLNINGSAVTRLARINSDGSLDTSFNNSNGPNNIVYSLERQSSGGLLVGGSFTTFGGFSKRSFLRLNADGTIDVNFNSGIAFSNGYVKTITVQPDDRIILGGQFSGTFTGTDNIVYPVRRITRLNSDGSYNTSFKTILNNICYTSAIDSEGRIMIGGAFNSVNGAAKYRIARLLACIDNTTYQSAVWSRGLPNKYSEVCIDSDLNLTTDTNFCNCSTATDKKLIVDGGNILTLELDVFGNATTRAGSIEFLNNASLIQKDSFSLDTGTIIYNRSSATLKDYDYVYWSSPVKEVSVGGVLPGFDKSWSYLAGSWVAASTGPGVGFIVRYKSNPIQKAAFTGLPNNGKIAVATQTIGSNLIGNPYPSALDADQFIEDNQAIIGSALYFWTHTTARAINADGTKYVYVGNDYATYNWTGGVGTSTAAVSTDNDADGIGDGEIPLGQIAAGQSFFIDNKSAGDFVFTNAMRITSSGGNSQFFKQSKTKKSAKVEKNRVWLSLTNDGGAFKQLLVGYLDGATNDYDDLYDGTTLNGNAYVNFYSIGNAKKYTIQGRSLPFDTADEVPLGYKTSIVGKFTISIDKVDGSLVGQSIYLEDKLTNTVFDLTKGAYSFTTVMGEFEDRFVLRYTDTAKLDTDAVAIKGKGVIVSVKNHQIKINSFDQNIAAVKVYDLKGSLLYETNKVNNKEFNIEHLAMNTQFMIVMIQLEDGKWISEEIIFQD